jgi:hypothetical protein
MTMRPHGHHIRAIHLQHRLAELQAHHPAAAARVRSRLGNAVVDRTASASGEVLLSAQIAVELTEAVAEEIGEDHIRAWGTRATISSFYTPLLRPVMASLEKVFGLATPEPFLAGVDHLWQAVFEGAGALHPRAGAKGCARVIGVEIPLVMLESPAFLAGLAGAFDAIFLLTRVNGATAIERVDFDGRTVAILAKWGASRFPVSTRFTARRPPTGCSAASSAGRSSA